VTDLTKRIVRLALAAAAVAAFAAPGSAQASEAACTGGTPPSTQVQCVKDLLAGSISRVCVPYGTYEICVPPVSA
jgi:type IV secretory pathway VirB2 component (pilin)